MPRPGAQKWDLRPLPTSVDLKESFGRWQAGLADVGWNSLYWDNHDQPRAVSRFGDDGRYRVRSATMLATILHLHRGTPYVYQGEELGMTNAPFHDIADFRDIESLNHYAAAARGRRRHGRRPRRLRTKSRDNARTPMQWEASPNRPGSRPARRGSRSTRTTVEINAEAAVADPDSVLQHYRALIALRHAEPAVVLGDFTMLLPDDRAVYAFTRRLDDVELLVVGNFSGALVAATIDDADALAARRARRHERERRARARPRGHADARAVGSARVPARRWPRRSLTGLVRYRLVRWPPSASAQPGPRLATSRPRSRRSCSTRSISWSEAWPAAVTTGGSTSSTRHAVVSTST